MKKLPAIVATSTIAVLSFGLTAQAGSDDDDNYPVPTTPPPTDQLPETGPSDTSNMVLIALGLLGAGGVMVASTTRRRGDQA